MKTGRTRIAIVVGSVLVALLLAAVVLAWLLFDADQTRENLEAGLEDSLDLDVQIGQPLRFGVLRGPTVTLEGLEISREGQVVATAETARVRLALSSLLTGTVRPVELLVERPEISIERHGPGVFNVYQPGPDPGEHDELSLRRLQVSDARLNFLDHDSGLEWLFEHCELDLRKIRHRGGDIEQLMASLAAEGELSCQSVRQDRMVAYDLSAQVHGSDGFFELEPVSAIMFDGQLSGRIEVDASSATPRYRLEQRLDQFDFGAFMSLLDPEQITEGKLDLALSLDLQGRSWQAFRNSASGTLSLNAGTMSLEGYDLDDELGNYAATQRFNLIDVGAVFLAGPVGLVASRGYAFTGLLEGHGGSTRIEQMVSEWTVEAGVAQAGDVAFRTPENRLALTGGLDFSEYRFEDFRVAVVDREGCAIVEQRITGPFRAPEIEQPNFLVAVIGPVIDLIERGVRAITDSDCEVFYTGTIPHPE